MHDTTIAQEVGFKAVDARAICDLGFQLVDAGDLEAAMRVFRGLLVLNPLDGATRAALGSVLQQAGQLTEAEAEYDQALKDNPRAVLALVNRGALKLNRGDQGGQADLRAAIQIDSPLKAQARRLLEWATKA